MKKLFDKNFLDSTLEGIYTVFSFGNGFSPDFTNSIKNKLFFDDHQALSSDFNKIKEDFIEVNKKLYQKALLNDEK